MPEAVEEILRWVTPARYMGRTATTDTEMHGQKICAGDWVLQLYAAGNRDPRVYDDPWAFEVSRRYRGREQLSFGWGQHVCLGAALGRLEARVMFEELLRRFPAYEITGPIEHRPSTLLNITSRLPVSQTG
jgi:cholest-4-en-3-one 26-monooxygenase